MSENFDHSPIDSSRRRALKIGAAAAVGAAVWTEPTIKGLARRPAYAAGSSASPIDFDVPLNTMLAKSDVLVLMSGGATLTITRNPPGTDETTYLFEVDVVGASLTNLTFTIDAVAPIFPTPPTTPFTLSGLSSNGNNRPVAGTIRCT